MNIAFFYERVLPSKGGCETYIVDISRRLLREGHQVHLYACEYDQRSLPRGVVVHPLPRPRGPRAWRPIQFGRLCLAAGAAASHDVTVGFNKTWGQDVLYPQGGLHSASFDCNLNKYRSPLTRLAAGWLKYLSPTQHVYRRIEKMQYLAACRPTIVVNSYMVRGHFTRYLGIPTEEMFVVRSAIDPQRFCDPARPKRRLAARTRWDIAPHETVALFAAMNYRLKGIVPLLHAVRELTRLPEYRASCQTFRVLIVGNARFRRYERLARRLGIEAKVKFAGHCPDMRDAYFASDFLVHPTFYDPCSLVVLEAFACGLPVITTRYNGASELMRPLQEGFVLDDPHDTSRLAWALGQLLDPVRRQACAKAALQAAQRWTFDHHFRALLQVFQQAAARKAAA